MQVVPVQPPPPPPLILLHARGVRQVPVAGHSGVLGGHVGLHCASVRQALLMGHHDVPVGHVSGWQTVPSKKLPVAQQWPLEQTSLLSHEPVPIN